MLGSTSLVTHGKLARFGFAAAQDKGIEAGFADDRELLRAVASPTVTVRYGRFLVFFKMVCNGFARIDIAEGVTYVDCDEPRLVVAGDDADGMCAEVEGVMSAIEASVSCAFATTTAFDANQRAVTRRGWRTGQPCGKPASLAAPLRATIKLGATDDKAARLRFRCGFVVTARLFQDANPDHALLA